MHSFLDQPLEFDDFKIVFIYYTLLHERPSIVDLYYDITRNNDGAPMTLDQFTVRWLSVHPQYSSQCCNVCLFAVDNYIKYVLYCIVVSV